MSGGHIEYGVMVDWPHGSSLVGPVTDELGSAKLHRDTLRKREKALAKLAGVEPPPVRLVMHTVTDWCDVAEEEQGKGGTEA